MRDLRIGDSVLTATDHHNKKHHQQFEKVYSFGHFQHSLEANFLQIHTDTKDHDGPLEISANHMIFAVDKHQDDHHRHRMIPASNLQTGDHILLGTGQWTAVRKIKKVSRKGAYAPFTPSGRIVVNGVMVSTYVAFQDSPVLKIGSVDTFLTYQWLAHAFESPHRVYCMMLDCKNESYTSMGVSYWVDVPLKGSFWLLRQHSVVMIVMLVPLVFLFGAIWVLEQSIVVPSGLLIVFVIGGAVWNGMSRIMKKKVL
eukprot:CAMPEP_0116825922 /NCGR_PEP_ID=MMETSP0418-20121206/2245_1 /TAXON_ID=1158023 /ORGANISM="Astrosyne radiata, Strain 13vi08-1A" /LENGTH=254 /DNA_ID=CAMNT_0004454505 /DNA_START=258 /DNA_END=1022 /DNA_ORIENTATION=+